MREVWKVTDSLKYHKAMSLGHMIINCGCPLTTELPRFTIKCFIILMARQTWSKTATVARPCFARGLFRASEISAPTKVGIASYEKRNIRVKILISRGYLLGGLLHCNISVPGPPHPSGEGSYPSWRCRGNQVLHHSRVE